MLAKAGKQDRKRADKGRRKDETREEDDGVETDLLIVAFLLFQQNRSDNFVQTILKLRQRRDLEFRR